MNGIANVLARKETILKDSAGIDYGSFKLEGIAFDYEALMESAGRPDEVVAVQRDVGVGDTPLIELRNVSNLVRKISPTGHAARIFVKDEAANPSGSFKDRRASVSVHHAKAHGYRGVIAATSGNYGAAVASQAAMYGLACIVVQEVFDSGQRGQPEILEKGRKCEALGAEVVQVTVGPELFQLHLQLLEETGYFNASLYTPYSILGIETLGEEIARQTRAVSGKDPDAVIVTHAGGGNVTGTARGLRRAGAASEVIGASVDLSGLHMASDYDFNRKSFTTGHTGFGVPFLTWPDRSDVPFNAARALRYLDRYVTVTQGQVFYATEVLARLEGLERGPAGNTSLAAAMWIAQHYDDDGVVVINETEYTGAGKHPYAQLDFARHMGVEVVEGPKELDAPGRRIAIPSGPDQMIATDMDLTRMKRSYLRRAMEAVGERELTEVEETFLAQDARMEREDIAAAARTRA